MPRPPSKRAVLTYLHTLAPHLGLTDWDFDLDTTTPAENPEAWAEIEVAKDKAFALIAFAPDLFTESPAEQRQVFCHELIHIHLAPLGWLTEEMFTKLGKTARGIAEASYARRLERACDDIARLIAPRLPLPPWTQK